MYSEQVIKFFGTVVLNLNSWQFLNRSSFEIRSKICFRGFKKEPRPRSILLTVWFLIFLNPTSLLPYTELIFLIFFLEKQALKMMSSLWIKTYISKLSDSRPIKWQNFGWSIFMKESEYLLNILDFEKDSSWKGLNGEPSRGQIRFSYSDSIKIIIRNHLVKCRNKAWFGAISLIRWVNWASKLGFTVKSL